ISRPDTIRLNGCLTVFSARKGPIGSIRRLEQGRPSGPGSAALGPAAFHGNHALAATATVWRPAVLQEKGPSEVKALGVAYAGSAQQIGEFLETLDAFCDD